MATVTLANATSTRIAENMLWEMWISIGQDGKVSGDEVNFIRDSVGLSAQLLPLIHKGVNSGQPSELAPDLKITPTKISFATSAFGDDMQDINASVSITGISLSPTSLQSTASLFNIDFASTSYRPGQPKTAANIIEKGTGKLAHTVAYPVALLANDVAGDAEMRLTAISQSNKSTSFEDVNGTRVTFNGTENRSFRTDLVLRDNAGEDTSGTYSGKLFSMANAVNRTGSDKTSNDYSIRLESKVGLDIDNTDTITGTIDSLSIARTYKSANYAESASYRSTSADAVDAAVLGRFFKGEATVTDVAAALFAGNDVITAQSGNTTLNGFNGNDRLVGGKGADFFQFTTGLNAQTNIDQIINFKKSGTDRIQLEGDLFVGYRGASDFVIGTAAIDAQDRIIFNRTTGALLYDADGNGAGAAVQFATLVGKVTLTGADIEII